MAPPSKKPKLAHKPTTASPKGLNRTLDQFFSSPKKKDQSTESRVSNGTLDQDEKLARQLQKDFDREYLHRENRYSPLANAVSEQKPADGDLFVSLPLDESDNNVSSVSTEPRPTKPTISKPNSVEEDEFANLLSTIPLESDLVDFDITKYNFIQQYSEKSVPYALLARMFELASQTKSRIKITNIMANTLRLLIQYASQNDLISAVWLMTNSVGPSYENIELGIGGSVLGKAIRKVSGISADRLRSLYHRLGDAGDVAYEAKISVRSLVRHSPLNIQNVYQTLIKIAEAKGAKSFETKQRLVEKLLFSARGEELRFITRTLVGNLRTGATKTTLLIALSRAFSLNAPEGATWEPTANKRNKSDSQNIFTESERLLKECYAWRPNYNDIIPALLSGGIHNLHKDCPVALHVPLMPMLGSITRDLGDLLRTLSDDGNKSDFACEYKYDGQRAQIHWKRGGKCSIFSRHLENMTDKYPDLHEVITEVTSDSVDSFIMEGEIVAYNSHTKQVETFQKLSTRARKDVQRESISVTICFFAFDLMYLNSEPLLEKDFRQRRQLLRTLFQPLENKFQFVTSIDSTVDGLDNISKFFKSALDRKCEGIMVKLLDSRRISTQDRNDTISKSRRKALLATYEPDKRLESWLKVKKDYDSNADSLDLIPIGAWHGQGRKSQWWSPILLAVREPETGILQAVCKCMSGFTDSTYKELKEKYSEDSMNVTSFQPSDIETPIIPPYFWVPQEVWEVKFSDVTSSPVYPAARDIMGGDRGLSIRFPRFIRRREDKTIEMASTPQFLADLYYAQSEMPEETNKSLAKEEF